MVMAVQIVKMIQLKEQVVPAEAFSPMVESQEDKQILRGLLLPANLLLMAEMEDLDVLHQTLLLMEDLEVAVVLRIVSQEHRELEVDIVEAELEIIRDMQVEVVHLRFQLLLMW